jgi:hypothetical protein
MLRPLDIVVMLKLSLENSERPPYLRLANELHLYPSEVYASVKRARASHLVQGPELGDRLNRSSLLEFLLHGIRYAFPAEIGSPTRGIPTSYAASPTPATCRLCGHTRTERFADTALFPSTRMSLRRPLKTRAYTNCWPWSMPSGTDVHENDSSLAESSREGSRCRRMPNPNLELLELAAEQLRPLLSEIVFVGGCATGLLIDDPAAAPVRGTYDVDVIAEIGSYAEYTVFSERLRALGFGEDIREGAPLCRWTRGSLTLDVMPLDAQVLGFSNRWYPDALRTAGSVRLPSGLVLRAINAPYFPRNEAGSFSRARST